MSVVGGISFQELMAVAEPCYTIPSHTFFSLRMLPAKYAEPFAKVQSVLTIVPYCSITTDMWSSKFQSRGYVTVTLAKRVLCIPATSVPSEHVLSSLGNIITKKHSWLKPENATKHIFLYENLTQF